jgi:beta-N-acetylhexosaminidase
VLGLRYRWPRPSSATRRPPVIVLVLFAGCICVGAAALIGAGIGQRRGEGARSAGVQGKQPAEDSPPREIAPRVVSGQRSPAALLSAHSPRALSPTGAATAQRSIVRQLSLRQLAGQRILYSYSGLTPPPSLLARIERGEAAGVIFFATNIASLPQLRSVIDRLQAANAKSPVHEPLLMLADQEGGLVRRLPGAPQLSEQQIGEGVDSLALAGQAGRSAGAELAQVGVNVDLAPVLDVSRSPNSFIEEYQRSYGADPNLDAQLGGAFVAALQGAGVAATAKHFPGLGAASAAQNTDEQPVTLALSLSQLHRIDERPYSAAITARVRLVMTSWAIYPALDPLAPAGLSARVIQDELRDRLGFRGVTITDSLAAGALRAYGTVAQRGVLAAKAGADLLLCSASNPDEARPAEGDSVLAALAHAFGSGELARGVAEAAVERVIALRAVLAR